MVAASFQQVTQQCWFSGKHCDIDRRNSLAIGLFNGATMSTKLVDQLQYFPFVRVGEVIRRCGQRNGWFLPPLMYDDTLPFRCGNSDS